MDIDLVGHVAVGFLYAAIGFWHLFNHIKLYALKANSYKSLPWFPTSKIRYLELIFILVPASTYIGTELFLGPSRHLPFDPDGSIPVTHLHNFEHSLISLSLAVYSAFAILLDKSSLVPKFDQCNLVLLIGAIAFGLEFLIFSFHSTVGFAGQYHYTLQILITLCLATTLMGIGLPNSFLISFVKSISLFSQGLWLMVMGCMIYSPELVPKGCILEEAKVRKEVRCGSEEALYRAKSLVNILFSFFVIVITIFSVFFYLAVFNIYSQKMEHTSLAKEFEELEEDFCNVDQPQGKRTSGKFMGKSSFTSFDMGK